MLAWILSIHILVFALLWFSPLSGWRLLVLAMVVLCGLSICLRRWRRPGFTGLCCRDGLWSLSSSQGPTPVELISYQRLFGMLLLVFRNGWRRHSLALLPDSASADELRRLRQLLLLGRASSSGQ